MQQSNKYVEELSKVTRERKLDFEKSEEKGSKKQDFTPRILATAMLSSWVRYSDIAIVRLANAFAMQLFSDTFLQLFKGKFATFLGLQILGEKVTTWCI